MGTDTAIEHDERYLRAKFDAVSSFTIGAEEELLLVDPADGRPMPTADLALELFGHDSRIVTELRACQLEIVTPVCICVADVARELAAVRRSLAATLDPQALVLAVGAHPSAADPGPLSRRPRYEAIAAAQPWAARTMLTCGLHVHVAVGGADRALAVYNALRSYLPEIIALGANAPFYDGRDSGLATVRPMLNRSLSRFGVPPAFDGWDRFSEFLTWADRSGTLRDVSNLWWDLRLHPATGTLEVRAADTQTSVADSAAIVALVQSLAYDLAGRYDAGELPEVHERERIEEAAFVATRDGLAGLLPDFETGAASPAWERVLTLVDRLRPASRDLGCSDELGHVESLALEGGGAARQRTIEAGRGVEGLIQQLAHETGMRSGRRLSEASAARSGGTY